VIESGGVRVISSKSRRRGEGGAHRVIRMAAQHRAGQDRTGQADVRRMGCESESESGSESGLYVGGQFQEGRWK
jgi:hypothetical protein